MKMNVKYAIAAVLVIALLWYPFLQGESTTSIEQMKEAIASSITDEYVMLDDKQVRKYFHLTEADTNGYIAYRSKDTMSAETLIIIRLQKPEDADHMMEKLKNYINQEYKKYDGYSHDQVRILDNYTMIEKKGYIFLSIGGNDQWATIFKQHL